MRYAECDLTDVLQRLVITIAAVTYGVRLYRSRKRKGSPSASLLICS